MNQPQPQSSESEIIRYVARDNEENDFDFFLRRIRFITEEIVTEGHNPVAILATRDIWEQILKGAPSEFKHELKTAKTNDKGYYMFRRKLNRLAVTLVDKMDSEDEIGNFVVICDGEDEDFRARFTPEGKDVPSEEAIANGFDLKAENRSYNFNQLLNQPMFKRLYVNSLTPRADLEKLDPPGWIAESLDMLREAVWECEEAILTAIQFNQHVADAVLADPRIKAYLRHTETTTYFHDVAIVGNASLKEEQVRLQGMRYDGNIKNCPCMTPEFIKESFL